MEKISISSELKLDAEEYLVAQWIDVAARSLNHTCHRSLRAARTKARKTGGRVLVCSHGVARYEIVEG